MRRLWGCAAVTLMMLGCGCGPKDPCAALQCPSGETCDPDAGACVPVPGRCDCPATRPVCEDGVCITCTAAQGCAGAKGRCDTSWPGGRCVECVLDADCPTALSHCEAATLTCAQCLVDAHCPATAPRCEQRLCFPALPDGGSAGDGGAGAGADAGVDGGGAADAGPTGETCGSALMLVPDAGAAVDGGTRWAFSLDTTSRGDDHAGSCNAVRGGPEAVYRVRLDAPSDLTVNAAPRAAGLDPVLWVRSGPCGAGRELACGDSAGADAGEQLTFRRLPAGDYTVYVESSGAAGGPLDASVTATSPAPPPANDACPAAELVTWPTDGGPWAYFIADTALASDQTTGSCNAEPGSAELAYAIQLTATYDVRVTSQPLGAQGDSVVYLRRAPCDGGVELACSDAPNAAADGFAQRLAPGIYHLYIESFGAGGAGPTEVRVARSTPVPPPSNDSCASPRVIASPGAVVRGTTDAGTNDFVDGCGSAAPDVVYTVTLDAGADLTATVTPEPGAPAFWPSVSIAGPGCTAANSLTCERATAPGRAATVTLNALDAGTYAIWVDGARAASFGDFTLRVLVSAPTPPPAHDVCAAALPLVFDGGAASVSGTTRFARDDYHGLCEAQAGRDVVYAFTTAQTAALTATVTPLSDAGAPFTPAVQLFPAAACLGDGGLDLGDAGAAGCVAAAQRGEVARLNVSTLPAGAWALVVDSNGAASGEFRLDLALTAVAGAPPNGTCAGAADLPPFTSGRASVEGTSRLGGDELSSVCLAPASGADVVYRFVTPLGGTGDAGFAVRALVLSRNRVELVPGVQLSASCSASAAPAWCGEGAGPLGEAVALARGLSAATPYYLWVDGVAAEAGAGPFTLEVAVASGSAHDGCASPVTAAANTSVAGTTLGAADDLSGVQGPFWYSGGPTCAAPLVGPDVVYRYVSAKTGTVVVTVLPERGFDPGVAVLSACAQRSCLSSADSASAGEAEVLSFEAQTGETYFIAVDSFTTAASGAGGFILRIEE